MGCVYIAGHNKYSDIWKPDSVIEVIYADFLVTGVIFDEKFEYAIGFLIIDP